MLQDVANKNMTALLQIRITRKLAADLQKVAEQEANTVSAVTRRLLTKGLSRELHPSRDDDRER